MDSGVRSHDRNPALDPETYNLICPTGWAGRPGTVERDPAILSLEGLSAWWIT